MKKGLHPRIFISRHSKTFEHLDALSDSKAIRARINYLLELGFQSAESGETLNPPSTQEAAGLTREKSEVVGKAKSNSTQRPKVDKSSNQHFVSPAVAVNAYAIPEGLVTDWNID